MEIQATQIRTPPIISINGANPATITVGTTYADLGATITAPQADLNLGLTVVIDNATSTDGTVQIDTNNPGTHTILYTVTDPNGLTGSATRTVIVSAPQQTPPPANDNTTPAANDNSPAERRHGNHRPGVAVSERGCTLVLHLLSLPPPLRRANTPVECRRH